LVKAKFCFGFSEKTPEYPLEESTVRFPSTILKPLRYKYLFTLSNLLRHVYVIGDDGGKTPIESPNFNFVKLCIM